jgi:uncharacterized phosphosugar-binding protein
MTAIDRYRENLMKTLDRAFDTQKEQLEAAADMILDTLKAGKMVYTFGTGHGHLLALEIFYRAGGMAKVCPVLDEKLMLHISAAGSTQEERKEEWVDELLRRYPMGAGDTLLIFSNSGRNAVPVGLAVEARKRGTRVIALTSHQHSSSVSSRSPRGLRLFEAADLVLDNCGIPGDASVEFSDGRRVGPTSTAVGAALLQAVVCRVKEKAMEEGVDAEFFVSSNVDGGDAVNDLLVEKYGGEIPGLK